MKKVSSWFLICTMLFFLTACGNRTQVSEDGIQPDNAPEESVTVAPPIPDEVPTGSVSLDEDSSKVLLRKLFILQKPAP